MSVTKKNGSLSGIPWDGDLFLEFLGDYHEEKWTHRMWYDIDCYIEKSCGNIEVKCYNYDEGYKFCNAELAAFKKYVLYQYIQVCCSKPVSKAWAMYCKIYGKKTRNISTQTEVSLDTNKKYYGPKVL